MYSSESHVGRLIELRIRTPITDEEAQQLFRSQLELVRRIGGQFVAVSDLREAHVFPGHLAEQFTGLMQKANPMLLRSALLISESAVFSLQAERVVEAAGNPARRAFRQVEELQQWLGEVLTEPERGRLRQFLQEA